MPLLQNLVIQLKLANSMKPGSRVKNKLEILKERSIAAELAENNLSRMRMAGAGNLLAVAQAGTLYGFTASQATYSLGVENRANLDGIVDGYASSVRRVNGAGEQALVRVTFTVDMPDGRRENFVTYLTDY